MILRNTQSALAAQSLCDLFVELRRCVFSSSREQLGVFIAFLTLRYVKPKCEINKAWTEEDLGQLLYFLSTLAFVSYTNLISSPIPGKASQRALEMLIFTENFTGPTFAYFFWFLRNLMLSSEADVTIMMDVLKIISKHSEMRGKKSGKKLNLKSPKLLPRTQMFEALIDVIGESGSCDVISVGTRNNSRVV